MGEVEYMRVGGEKGFYCPLFADTQNTCSYLIVRLTSTILPDVELVPTGNSQDIQADVKCKGCNRLAWSHTRKNISEPLQLLKSQLNSGFDNTRQEARQPRAQ